MIAEPLAIPDLFRIRITARADHRGSFARLFCARELASLGIAKPLEQINHSHTRRKGSIRGLHFQYPPKAETKIIFCLRGSVFDVALDIRRNSPRFLQWHAEILRGESPTMLLIPEGFAHGFQTLEQDTELLYLHTQSYAPELEGGIRFNDPRPNIQWPLHPADISKKDRALAFLEPSFAGIAL